MIIMGDLIIVFFFYFIVPSPHDNLKLRPKCWYIIVDYSHSSENVLPT